jgi:hypothetical protein
MLSEVLSALKELRSELQDQLARQPEYRALLILDRATSQLGDVVAPIDLDGPAASQIPPADQPQATTPTPPAPGRLTIVRNAALPLAPARDRGDDAQRATRANPSAPARLAQAPRAQAGGGRVPPPFRPPDTMTDARRWTSDGALPPAAAANPFAGVAQHTSATIAEFRAAALADGAQLAQAHARRHANLAAAPMIVVNGLADPEAPTAPAAATHQGAPAASAIDEPPAELAAAPIPTAADAENALFAGPPEKTLLDRTAAPPAPATIAFGPTATSDESTAALQEAARAGASGLSADRYETAGDAHDLEDEDRAERVAPAEAEASADAAEVDGFDRTLAEAAKVASSPAKATAPRRYLPILSAQRIVPGRR